MHTAITIDALKVLDAIDRKGSFAGAANELFRVPSAISYTVQKLEEDLNVAIFDRTGHRAALTPAGRYLLEEGRTLLEAAENLAHTTRQVAQGWETRLRIGFNSLLRVPVSRRKRVLRTRRAGGSATGGRSLRRLLGCAAKPTN